jgi:ABC-type multidrug transport system fused ATPase/permease subunit
MTRGKTLAVNSQVTEQPTRKLLWQLLESSERRALGGLFSLMLIGTLFETLSVGLLIPVLSVLTSTDSNIESPFGVLNTGIDRTTLIWIVVVGVFFVYVIKNVFLALSVWIQRGYLTRLTARFGSDILKAYVLQPFAFHLKKNSSTLIRNTQDASVLVAGGIEPLLTVTSEGLIAVSLFLVLVIVEPLGTLLVVGALVLATMLFQRLSSKRLSMWGTQRQFEKGKIIQTIQQSLGAVKDVQVLGRENWFIGQHEVHQQNDGRLLRKIITVQSLPRLWLEVMAIGGLTGLVGVMLGSGKDSSEIVPVVGLFAATAFRVLPSINKIVGSKQQLKVSRAAIETIYADLHLPVRVTHDEKLSQLVFSDLVTRDLEFTYEGTERSVLDDVCVHIKAGEAVGFVGQSGSGKSTLIDIMLGLLEPQSGSVMINGQDIFHMKSAWQKSIGYIPQAIFLMDDSLRRNIAIGIADNEIDDVAIRDALKSAQLEDFVNSLSEGLDTMVGERGVRLSGGQRQRIGIARALYHRPSVLVLDEATSSLDTETEHGVMQAVRALQGDKTVLIVAHRLSTVEYCDRLYRLDAGRIVDEGRFEEVMNRTQTQPD